MSNCELFSHVSFATPAIPRSYTCLDSGLNRASKIYIGFGLQNEARFQLWRDDPGVEAWEWNGRGGWEVAVAGRAVTPNYFSFEQQTFETKKISKLLTIILYYYIFNSFWC